MIGEGDGAPGLRRPATRGHCRHALTQFAPADDSTGEQNVDGHHRVDQRLYPGDVERRPQARGALPPPDAHGIRPRDADLPNPKPRHRAEPDAGRDGHLDRGREIDEVARTMEIGSRPTAENCRGRHQQPRPPDAQTEGVGQFGIGVDAAVKAAPG
jgi:hypothetical protein